MNEIEARSKIKYRIEVAREIAGNGVDGKAFEDLEIAIQALKEIREYRELGTVEELKAIKQWKTDVIECFCKYDASSFEEIVVNARKKAIDEFAERMKELIYKWIEKGVIAIGCIDEIAEQLKGGAE